MTLVNKIQSKNQVEPRILELIEKICWSRDTKRILIKLLEYHIIQ